MKERNDYGHNTYVGERYIQDLDSVVCSGPDELKGRAIPDLTEDELPEPPKILDPEYDEDDYDHKNNADGGNSMLMQMVVLSLLTELAWNMELM